MKSFYGTRVPRAVARFYPDLVWRMQPVGRDLYLTFDDGPTAEATTDILELLDRYRIRASFFLIGRRIVEHPNLAAEIARAGHTVGNHTYTHPNAWRIPADRLEDELRKTTDVIAETTGRVPHTMRPPYGRFNRVMRRWSQANGQRIVMWDVLTWDFLKGVKAVQIARYMQNHVRPGSIVVLHDNPRTYRETLKALDASLPAFLDQGWNFRAL